MAPDPLPPAATGGDQPTCDHLALVLNAGSTTLKAALLNAAGERLWQGDGQPDQLPAWLGGDLAAWMPHLTLVAHRLVHGGERFQAPTRLTPAVIDALEALVPLAPLHNGPAVRLIQELACWLAAQGRPAPPQWACFDTAFHASLPEPARTYAIPAAWRRQGLRRFGFHGLNHQHLGETVASREPAVRRLISAHLGGGCSLCAITISPSGALRSIDTSMGFTPLEGLVMASRSGSVDPGLLLHLLRQGTGAEELDGALNHSSGLLGLSELSGDMRALRQAAASGHPGARLAIAVFRHRLLQGIGAMAASLGGADAIALSGGIGEHDQALRAELQAALGWMGPLRWLVIPADEEGLMARQCLAQTP